MAVLGFAADVPLGDNGGMELVTDAAEVARLAAAIAGAPMVGFDCEFLSQDRLVPRLCLLQLVYEAEGVTHVALVDALAADVRPLAEALAAHRLPIAHAPRQDLQLLAARFAVTVPQVFDLQIAAAFVGLGDQVGYSRLVAAVLGAELEKDSQWTDWAARPLSPAQLAYAAGDVQHLLPLYRDLAARLGPRLSWAVAECQRLAEVAWQAAALQAEDAWEEVSGAAGLPPRATSVVMALAAWRLSTARELDKPLGHVLSDRTLVELARRPPRDVSALRRRCESATARERVEELLPVIQAAERQEAAPRVRRGPLGRRAEAWVPGLLLIVESVAAREQIAPRLLATRADIESLARAFDQEGVAGAARHPVMNGWRRELVGVVCAGWLAGELAIVTDSKGGDGVAGDGAGRRDTVRVERRGPTSS